MEVIFLLLPLTLLLAASGVAGFIWAVSKGQLEDLETPAHRILFDETGDSALNFPDPVNRDDAAGALGDLPAGGRTGGDAGA